MITSKFFDGMRWVHNKDEMPTEPHYAVMTFSSIHIPGDERSRTNPGHGYAAETVLTKAYIVFESRDAWERYTKSNHNDQMIAMHVTPAAITTQTNVSITLS